MQIYEPREDSELLRKVIKDYSKGVILDMGTGTGILAIAAVKSGAENVDAVDIYEDAVKCAKHNIELNQLSSKVKVWQSDLFSKIPSEKKYDLIIANLPILNYPETDLRFHSLSDPNFQYHKRLFEEVQKYIKENGIVRLAHADLQTDGFEQIESVAKQKGFKLSIIKEIVKNGYKWRNYEFKLE